MKMSPLFVCLLILAITCFASCKKQKAENALEGHWVISIDTPQVEGHEESRILGGIEDHPLVKVNCWGNIAFSGEMTLDKDGNGHIVVNATHCDTSYVMYETDISSLFLTQHLRPGLGKPRRDNYGGIYNKNVYFDCYSNVRGELITKKTNGIHFDISGAYDEAGTGFEEEIRLCLGFKRD
jgi:hypothetical protein